MQVNDIIEKLLAGRWIAGRYPQDALERTKRFNSKHMRVLINFLGEGVTDEKEISKAVHTYMNLIYNIKRQNLNADLSIKPTQLGLSISKRLMESNYLKIVKYAKEKGIFVWFDMEEPEYVDSTINAYVKSLEFGNTGICIQAYLKRSPKDVENLLKRKAVIRLVKGAYNIEKELGFQTSGGINKSFSLLMKKLFEKSNKFMIATHNGKLINEAIKLNKKYKRDVTYSMLNGIRNNYALDLVRSGQKVALYVPFGSDWLGYSLRRLNEQGHLLLILRSIFEKQNV